MSNYNIQMHNYNGVGYDNLYPKTKSNMVLDGDTNLETKLKYYSNENLLDNWYFVGGGSQQGGGQFPINQRGKTSYTTDRGYTIDRWRFAHWQAVSPTVTIGNDGLTISSSTAVGTPNSCLVEEILENGNVFAGKTMTLSILVGSNSFAYRVGVFNSIGDTRYAYTFVNSVGLTTLTFTVPNDADGLTVQIGHSGSFGGSGPINTTIQAVKLELGSTQTLAHQDSNGNWVLNDVPPNFQQELAKCQRYQVVYGGSAITSPLFIGNAETSSYILGTLTLPVPLAKAPTLSLTTGSGIAAINCGVYYGCDTISLLGFGVNKILCNVHAINENLTKGAAYNCYMVNVDEYLIIDANL